MRVPFVSTTGICRVCGQAAEGISTDYVCVDCEGPCRPAFDRAVSAVRFEDKAREMVLGFKFRERLWLRDDFVDWLEAAARAHYALDAVDLVLPMPLTLYHQLDRGYNQSDYLASALATRLGRRYRTDLLKRVGNPARQSELNEADRRKNVLGTFAVKKPAFVRGRTILVVDDVMTTGSTLSECAKTLKAAGATRVWCLTLARSVI